MGWWALRRWGAQVVSVEQSVAGRRMPPLSTVVNAGLQVIIVGLGASIGREVAPSLFVWAVAAGPVLGFAAIGFVRLVRFAESIRPRSWWILLVMPVVFTIVGLIAIPFPEVLGNGRVLGQTTFSGLVLPVAR